MELAGGRDLTLLSVQDIAAHAGVSEGLLHPYFPTMDALLVAAVQRAANAMGAALDVAVQGLPGNALDAGLHAYLDHVQADPTGWSALLQARSGPVAAIGVDEPSPLLRAALERVGGPGACRLPGLAPAPAGAARGGRGPARQQLHERLRRPPPRHDDQAGAALERLGEQPG